MDARRPPSPRRCCPLHDRSVAALFKELRSAPRAARGRPASRAGSRLRPAGQRRVAAARRRAPARCSPQAAPAGHRAGRLVRRALSGPAGLHSRSAAGALGARRSGRARQSRRSRSSGRGPRPTTRRQVGERLGAELAGRGIVVASGLARGVDSAAHRGLSRRGGRHGCRPRLRARSGLSGRARGSGGKYLLNKGLWSASWALARRRCRSTSRCGTGSSAGSRLAVVVVEASEKSGSLITARCALEQGRDVMAVPGSVLSGRNRGSHGLLKDGAKVVESADDILEELGWPSPEADGRRGRGASESDPLLLANGGRRGLQARRADGPHGDLGSEAAAAVDGAGASGKVTARPGGLFGRA